MKNRLLRWPFTIICWRALTSAFALVVLTVASTTNVHAADSPPALRIGALPIDQTSDIFYAQDAGFFKAEGLNVEVTTMQSGPAIISALAGGALDIGSSNVASVASAREAGIALRVLSPSGLHAHSVPTDLLMVANDSLIQTGRDLNGKTIAVNALGTLPQVSVQVWLDRNGGSSSTVHFVEVPFPQMLQALQLHRVDAASMAEPFITIGKGQARAIGDPDDAISRNFLEGSWLATEAWIAQHPAKVRKFVSAMHKAHEWANKNQMASAAILVHHTKIAPEIASKMTRTVFGTTLDMSQIQPLLDIAYKYGMIKQPMASASIVQPEH
jgi:NitT/TauT family transport system substrate-binding protein